VVICLEQGADLHMAQLMPLLLTVSCFSKIQIGLTFLVPAHPGSPGKRAVKRVCVCLQTFIEDAFYSVFYAGLLLSAGGCGRYPPTAVGAMLQASVLSSKCWQLHVESQQRRLNTDLN